MATARSHPPKKQHLAGLPAVRWWQGAALVAASCFASVATLPPTPAVANGQPQKRTRGNFDRSAQRLVVAAGLMRGSKEGFNGAQPLTGREANHALGLVAQTLAHQGVGGTQPPTTRLRTVSVVSFDALLDRALGLAAVAAHVEKVAQAAGLRPPWYFGSEVVARFLELRYEQPLGFEALDLYPNEPITRAEAAYSLARVLKIGAGEIGWAQQTLAAFALPHYQADQLAPLRIAVSLIGYPYVWGGTTDGTEDGLAHGGFDCSGFVWRVYKLSGLPWGAAIRGRTAAQQAAEIPQRARLRINQLEPGDLLFFGSAGFHGRVSERSIVHEGLYLGNNWVIHSSAQGVYVLPLRTSWLGASFAFGRRVLPD